MGWGGWGGEGQPAERGKVANLGEAEAKTEWGFGNSVTLSHFLSWVTADAPTTLQSALSPAKAALKWHSVTGPFRGVDFGSSHNHNPTHTPYVRSAGFKLTKELCMAISNGECISSAFWFSFR